LPSKERAADQIATNSATGEFAIARRSGSVTIFDKAASPVAYLVGNPASDGWNLDFKRVAFDAAGKRVLTVSKDGVRIWHRPEEPLLKAVRTKLGLDDGPPTSFTQAFEGRRRIEPCLDREDMVIDDSGSVGLCIRLNGHNEILPTGLTKEEFVPAITTEMEKGLSIALWNSGHYLRLFALNPDRVLEYVDHDADIWVPGEERLSAIIK